MKKGSAIQSLTKIVTNNIHTYSSVSTQQSNTTAATTTVNINTISADTAYVSLATANIPR